MRRAAPASAREGSGGKRGSVIYRLLRKRVNKNQRLKRPKSRRFCDTKLCLLPCRRRSRWCCFSSLPNCQSQRRDATATKPVAPSVVVNAVPLSLPVAAKLTTIVLLIPFLTPLFSFLLPLRRPLRRPPPLPPSPPPRSYVGVCVLLSSVTTRHTQRESSRAESSSSSREEECVCPAPARSKSVPPVRRPV